MFDINHLNTRFQSVKLLLMRPELHCRGLEVNDDQNQIHRLVDEHKQLRMRTTSHELHEDKYKIKSTAEQKQFPWNKCAVKVHLYILLFFLPPD